MDQRVAKHACNCNIFFVAVVIVVYKGYLALLLCLYFVISQFVSCEKVTKCRSGQHSNMC